MTNTEAKWLHDLHETQRIQAIAIRLLERQVLELQKLAIRAATKSSKRPATRTAARRSA